MRQRFWRRCGKFITAAMCMSVSLTGCCGLDSLMRHYGYTPLKPPSTLLAPGAMVYIKSHNPFVAGVVCSPKESLGEGWAVKTSPTTNSQLNKIKGQSFNIQADVIDAIKADVTVENVESVIAYVSNAVLAEINDTDVLSNLRYRTSQCVSAIKKRRAEGFKVTMVSSALIADVSYSVNWKQNMSIEAKAKIDALSNLALKLGGNVTSDSSYIISAKGLVWGIKDDLYLAALSMADVDETVITPGTQALPAQAVPRVVVDAPDNSTAIPLKL